MLKTLGIVRAKFHSPRFWSIATRRLGGRALLEWVVRRVTDATRLNGVIVLGDRNVTLENIRHLVPSDVPVCITDKDDELGCFARALEQYPAEGVVHIDADNLFVDPTLIDRLVNTAYTHPECDYIGYCSRDGKPVLFSPVGVYADWFKAEALHKANRMARNAEERRRTALYFHSHPEKFNLRFIPVPPEIDRDDLRLMIDVEEDWEHVLALYEVLGQDWLEWREIARLLDHQPALRNRMATLNRQRRETASV